jgi:hypothetical protein
MLFRRSRRGTLIKEKLDVGGVVTGGRHDFAKAKPWPRPSSAGATITLRILRCQASPGLQMRFDTHMALQKCDSDTNRQ